MNNRLLIIGVILSYVMLFALLFILPLSDGPYYTPHEIGHIIKK